MDFLPIFLKLKGRPCLVVGGGKGFAEMVAQVLDGLDLKAAWDGPDELDNVGAKQEEETNREWVASLREPYGEQPTRPPQEVKETFLYTSIAQAEHSQGASFATSWGIYVVTSGKTLRQGAVEAATFVPPLIDMELENSSH